jgi:hypothetical protein
MHSVQSSVDVFIRSGLCPYGKLSKILASAKAQEQHSVVDLHICAIE